MLSIEYLKDLFPDKFYVYSTHLMYVRDTLHNILKRHEVLDVGTTFALTLYCAM